MPSEMPCVYNEPGVRKPVLEVGFFGDRGEELASAVVGNVGRENRGSGRNGGEERENFGGALGGVLGEQERVS